VRVGIIGLGLIGGSLARDLAAAGHEVVGADRSAATLRAARRARVIVDTLDSKFDGIESCDACVIALPVDAAIGALKTAASRLADVPLITDVGSTKRSIVKAAETAGLGRRFVGGHPLAGDHASGWAASRSELFVAQRVYLTPTRSSAPAAVHRARKLWSSVGARPVMMDAKAHDALLAATSHLPQVTALALAMVLADSGIPRSTLGRGGKDMTRLAASNPEVWSAILADNGADVSKRIAGLRKTLSQIEERVRRDDRAALKRLIARCGRWAGR
jgi:prephenate dehydrogenase